MGSYQYVVGDTSLEVALKNERDNRDVKLVKSTESNQNRLVDGDDEGKKINIGTKTDSYSVSKIWLWSKKGKFASSSNAEMDYPSCLETELPWMGETQGK